MKPKPVLRIEPDLRPGGETPEFLELNELPRLAAAIRVITEQGGAIPADSRIVEGAVRALGVTDVEVTPERLDALVTLGVLERVMIGRTLHLVWRSGARDSTPLLPRTVELSATVSQEERAFRLDIELDIEHERLLLYRVLLVLEAVAGALGIRQILLWYVQG